jgi:Phage Tail Collar Domain
LTSGAGPVTLNVDGLGAKALRAAPGVELAAGTLISGTPYVARYVNSASEWILCSFFGANPYNVPLGAGMPYFLPAAPNSSFAFPSGQPISRTTYAALFALMGTTYGAGDGSTTFNLPSLGGRLLACRENMKERARRGASRPRDPALRARRWAQPAGRRTSCSASAKFHRTRMPTS